MLLLALGLYLLTLAVMVGVDLATDGRYLAAAFGKDSPRRTRTTDA